MSKQKDFEHLSKKKTISQYLGVGSRFAQLLSELIDEYDGTLRQASLIVRLASYEMGGPAEMIEFRRKKDGKVLALASHPGVDKKNFRHRDMIKPVFAVSLDQKLFMLTSIHEIVQKLRGADLDHRRLQKQLGRPPLVVVGKHSKWSKK